MRRREFIALLSGTVWPGAARAQQPAKKVLRVGTVSALQQSSPQWVAFMRRMAELGYQEGETFSFDFVRAGNEEEYESGYRILAARELNIILATGPEIALKSALAATRTLPISAASMFWDRLSADQWQAAQNAATTLGLRLFGIELRTPPYDYERALHEAPPDYRGMLIVATSPFFFRDRARIADIAFRQRIASIFVFREWVEAGGLLSYGPSIAAQFVRVAEFVDRIARGAKPADLPIEQPTKFELVVNLKTAKAIGIKLSTAILLRADEVIE
jgi:putative ABC transport system substrate-binding protein